MASCAAGAASLERRRQKGRTVMRFAWWHAHSGRAQKSPSSGIAAALGRWGLSWPARRKQSCLAPSTQPALGMRTTMPQRRCSRIELTLEPMVEVSRATQCLLHELHCDGWYVACRHDHQLIVRLIRASAPQYAVCFQCRPDVEKAVYHASRAWALSLIPLNAEGNLDPDRVAALRAALANLQAHRQQAA